MTLNEYNITKRQVATLYMNAIPFGLKIGIQKWYLGQTGGGGVLLMLGFRFTWDLVVSLVQANVEQT